MSDSIKKIIDGGTGVYSISKQEAGEIHKAAKKVKKLRGQLLDEE